MKEIYILSCAPVADGGGVYKYSLRQNGELKESAYLPCDRPMYAVRDGNRLHVLLRAPFGGTNRLNANARCLPQDQTIAENEEKYSGYFSCLTDFSCQTPVKSTLGECACHLAVEGGNSYVVNYLSGNIVKDCQTACMHEGIGVNLPRQNTAHTHFVTFSPDKKFVLCCDLGLDTVFTYDRNLNEISKAKVPAGYGVRHLVFSNDGHTVYAVNELKPSVSVFSFDKGELFLKNTVVLPCENAKSTAAAIRLSADGKTLYVSVRGENVIFVLRPDGNNLEILQKEFCGGNSPRDFAVFDNVLVCCNESSDNVSIWEMEEGKLKKQINSVKLKGPLCVL